MLNDNCDQMALCGYWGVPGNHLFVASTCQCHRKKCEKFDVTSANKDFADISHLAWDSDMHCGKLRKLVSESREPHTYSYVIGDFIIKSQCNFISLVIFLEVQRVVKESISTLKQPDIQLTNQLLNFSHQYMSSLKSTLSEVQGLLKFKKDGKEREVLEKQLKMLEPFELLWGLCEVLFIDNTKGGYILGPLLDWLRLRFYDTDLKVQKVIESKQGEKHQLYWDVMYMFVLQGRIEEARRLLMLHSDSRSDLCMRIDILLGHMPVYSPNNPRLSFTEWSMKWQQWHMTCTEHVEEGIFAKDENLNMLCKILAGEEEAFNDLKHLLGSWYCLLISKLFYQSPMIPSSELKRHTQPCINQFNPEVMTSWDKVVVSVFHLNIKQAIDECCSSFNNWWFVCHLVDLLEHRGCLEARILPFGSTLREFVLFEYANCLVSDSSFLEVGLDYLAHCHAFGRAHMEELILRSHLETDNKVRKMIRICEKYNMKELIGMLCREQGLKDIRKGLIGSALFWCIKSKDADFAVLLVRRILLEGMVAPKDLGQFDFINNFGTSLSFSNEMTLLGKLTEYQRLCDQTLYVDAANTLLLILSEKSSKRFWRFLFFRLGELLNVSPKMLPSNLSKKFLECLTDYELFFDIASHDRQFLQEIKEIRVCLAQTVAINIAQLN